MTTPIFPDIPLPFGVVLTPASGTNALSPAYIQLPAGINTLQVTWDQPESLGIYSSPQQSHSTRVLIATVPAGSSRRTLMIPGIGVHPWAPRYVSFLSGLGIPSSNSEATVQIFTTPLQ